MLELLGQTIGAAIIIWLCWKSSLAKAGLSGSDPLDEIRGQVNGARWAHGFARIDWTWVAMNGAALLAVGWVGWSLITGSVTPDTVGARRAVFMGWSIVAAALLAMLAIGRKP